MPVALEMEFFLVQNQEGKYFRAKGFSGYGLTWVDWAQDAKVYTKLGQARSRVTFFAKSYPEYGIPKIIRIKVQEGEVLEEEVRVKKAIKSKELKELQQKRDWLEKLQMQNVKETHYLRKHEDKLRKEIAEIESRLS